VVEGTYLFPLPSDAAVTGFTLWIDGKPVEGEVLDADQARRTYEEIVRRMIDPALLEYAGQGAVRARVFPFPRAASAGSNWNIPRRSLPKTASSATSIH
jgi:Ca-activated chloride channel family protein